MESKELNEWFKWLESDEGEAAIAEFKKDLTIKKKIREGRFDKFEKWLEENDFDKLLYRLILQHSDEYRNKFWEWGCEPYPNNIMNFIFTYVVERVGKIVHIKELDCDFPNAIWEFNGYYFQIIWGQGSIQTIYNKKDKKEIFSI